MEKYCVILGLLSLVVPTFATWYCMDQYHRPVQPGQIFLAGCYECLCRYPQEPICRRRHDNYPHIHPDYGVGPSYPWQQPDYPVYPTPRDYYPPIIEVYPPTRDVTPPPRGINPPIRIQIVDKTFPEEKVAPRHNENPTTKKKAITDPIFKIDPVKTIPH